MAIQKKHHFVTEVGDNFSYVDGDPPHSAFNVPPGFSYVDGDPPPHSAFNVLPGSIVIQIHSKPDPSEAVLCRLCANHMMTVYEESVFVGRHCPNNCPPSRRQLTPEVAPMSERQPQSPNGKSLEFIEQKQRALESARNAIQSLRGSSNELPRTWLLQMVKELYDELRLSTP